MYYSLYLRRIDVFVMYAKQKMEQISKLSEALKIESLKHIFKYSLYNIGLFPIFKKNPQQKVLNRGV